MADRANGGPLEGERDIGEPIKGITRDGRVRWQGQETPLGKIDRTRCQLDAVGDEVVGDAPFELVAGEIASAPGFILHPGIGEAVLCPAKKSAR